MCSSFLCSFFYVSSQTGSLFIDSLTNKMSWFSKKTSSSTIYSHFDKNVYSPGETVWFASYVLNPITSIQAYQTVSIAVVKNEDKKVFQNQEYALFNGIARGNIILSDSLKPGAYSLMVYTNLLKNGMPEDVFIQPITIRQSGNPDMKIILKNLESKNIDDSIKVEVKLVTNSIAPITNQFVNYVLGTGSSMTTGKVKTDGKGEAIIALKKSITNIEKSLLKVFVEKGFDYRESYIQLPKYEENVKVTFYPEGGTLLSGLVNVIGIETKDVLGTPIAVKGGIYEGDNLVEKIATSEEGMAKFSLNIENGKQYYFKVEDKQYATSSKTMLPNALSKGYGLQIKNSVCNDTLDLTILSTDIDKKVTIILHNYQEVYSSVDVVFKKNIRKIKFPLTTVPKGLLAVTLLDENKQPWAERLFFANYHKRLQLSIQPIENRVNVRGKATVKVKITDSEGNPQQAYFSFACVQDNKVENKKATDLESYFSVGNHISSMGVGLSEAFHKNKQSFDLHLLIKGWRKYKWQAMLETVASDTLSKIDYIRYKAIAKPAVKAYNPSYTMQLLKEEKFELVQSSTDEFEVEPSFLHTFGKKIMVSLQDKRKDNIPFSFENPFKPVAQKFTKENSFLGSDYGFATFKKQPITTIALEESVNQLDEVIVTTYVKCTRPTERNACGDYVCKTLALNCPVHVTCGTPAIDGQKYYMTIGGKMQLAVYNCFGANKAIGANFLSIVGIKREKVFYGVDYELDGKDDQIFLTTLHWNGGNVTNSTGEAEITFNTSDLVGKFKCIVNGITANDKFSGSTILTVVKPKIDN